MDKNTLLTICQTFIHKSWDIEETDEDINLVLGILEQNIKELDTIDKELLLTTCPAGNDSWVYNKLKDMLCTDIYPHLDENELKHFNDYMSSYDELKNIFSIVRKFVKS